MAQNAVFLLETLLFEGGALAFGVWQFWSVRPNKKAKPDEPSALSRTSPEDPGHPEG
jgi:hypothetical protein